jgi:transcriptional regulator with XRE-family HTH domain
MENEEKRSLSNTLVDALRARGFTVEKLSEITGVSERFLESLIEDKFETLPSLPYIRGYLMKIADALGLDGEELFKEYLKDNEAVKRSGKNDRLPENRFKTPKFTSKVIIPLLIILGVLLYIFLRVPIFEGRDGLLLRDLDEDITYSSEPTFGFSGKIGDSYKLTLNGERIYPDEGGNFTAQIELKSGFNTLVFGAKKFLGKEKTVTKQIFYQTPVEENTIQNGEE